MTALMLLSSACSRGDSHNNEKTANEQKQELNALADRLMTDETFFLEFVGTDPQVALAKALEAQKVDPKNIVWYYVIGMVFNTDQYQANNMVPEARKRHYAKTLDYLQGPLEKLQQVMQKPLSKERKEGLIQTYNNFKLDNALALLEADRLAEAKKLAKDALNNNIDIHSWNYGNIINAANTILGRVALREGDIEEAKIYLMLSAETTGSPQLNSFGPSFILARELLQQGEKNTVLGYLDRIAVFWIKASDKYLNFRT